MECVWSNTDLKRMIFSFGYPEHRVYMKKINDSFHLENRRRRHRMECLDSDFRLANSNIYFLDELLTIEEQCDLWHQMIDCKCCTHHINAKPVRSMLWLYDKTQYNMWLDKHNYEDGCACKCKVWASTLLCTMTRTNHPTLRYRGDGRFMIPAALRETPLLKHAIVHP